MHFPSAGSARIVRNAILPEMHGKHEKRSTANMNINKNVLSLMVNAQDLTAMKASVNSYLKLVLLVTNLQNLE
ncbi:hypothetical protein KKC44_06365 [Patescibacteria group bacterium]|nr:hypothetical protein [Patescibacteria group bacterium]